MKLGTQTGSLVNHMLSRAVIGQPAPFAGMGVTFLSWTDRNPGTVFRVFQVGSRQMMQTRDDCPAWDIPDDPKVEATFSIKTRVNGHQRYWRLDGDTWRAVRQNDAGRWVLTGGNGIRLGERDYYRDPSF